MTVVCLCNYVFVGLYVYVFIFLCPLIFRYLCVYTFVYLSVSIPLLRKHYCSTSFIALIVLSLTILNHIPTKKPCIAWLMSIKGKAIAIITKAIAESFCPLPVYFRPLLVEFPYIYQIWLILDNLNSFQYLKSTSTYKKYACLVKYFYANLVFVVWGFYLPKIKAIFWATLLLWYNSTDTKI